MNEFNGDYRVSEEFLKIKKEYNIEYLIETGTHHGNTTRWFSENFQNVYTFEINKTNLNFAKSNLKDTKNIKYFEGDSYIEIDKIIDEIKDKRCFFFLDAHPNPAFDSNALNPTPFELDIISKMNEKPCIAIHDIGSCFNNFDNQVDNILPYANKIYGKDNYEFYTNENNRCYPPGVTVLYILPKKKNSDEES
jgi:hypothetical protein